MKTLLPATISNIEEAKKFLTDLIENDECYHPEDNAHEINWQSNDIPQESDCDLLNKLMLDIYKLEDFDPCEFILNYNHKVDVTKPVKIKDPENDEEAGLIYEVTNYNQLTGIVYIRPTNSDLVIPSEESLNISQIENV